VLWYGPEGELLHRYSFANKSARERFYEALFYARNRPTSFVRTAVAFVSRCGTRVTDA